MLSSLEVVSMCMNFTNTCTCVYPHPSARNWKAQQKGTWLRVDSQFLCVGGCGCGPLEGAEVVWPSTSTHADLQGELGADDASLAAPSLETTRGSRGGLTVHTQEELGADDASLAALV